MYNQIYIFAIFILYGLLTGLLFDFFRVLRKSFRTSNIITYIHDIIFWLIVGITLLFTIFRFNNGELRGYIFIGIGIGVSMYLLVFSRPFISISVVIVQFMKTAIQKYAVIPVKICLKFLMKIIFAPLHLTLTAFKRLMLKINLGLKLTIIQKLLRKRIRDENKKEI